MYFSLSLPGFSDEIAKIARSVDISVVVPKDPKKKEEKAKKKTLQGEDYADERKRKASLAEVGVGLGSTVLVMGALKDWSKKGITNKAQMREYVTEMQHAMGLKNPIKVRVPTPFTENPHPASVFNPLGGTLDPYYFGSELGPIRPHVSIPLRSRDSIIAHEIGHALNDQGMKRLGKIPHSLYKVVENTSRGASPLASMWATTRSVADRDPTYKPALVNLVVQAPMLLEEAVASARAVKHFAGQHGLKGGLKKSFPLAPAFATYALGTVLPFGVTAWRKHRRRKFDVGMKENLEKELGVKLASADALQRASNYFSLWKRAPASAATVGMIGGGMAGGALGKALSGHNKKKRLTEKEQIDLGKKEIFGGLGGSIAGGALGLLAGKKIQRHHFDLVSKGLRGMVKSTTPEMRKPLLANLHNQLAEMRVKHEPKWRDVLGRPKKDRHPWLTHDIFGGEEKDVDWAKANW